MAAPRGREGGREGGRREGGGREGERQSQLTTEEVPTKCQAKRPEHITQNIYCTFFFALLTSELHD